MFRLSLYLLVLVCAQAQETISNGSISGRVTDATGAVVENAQVTARQMETNLTAATVTDREGRFRFPYLRLGPYEITVHQPGFGDAKRSLLLTVGSAFEVPIVLAVASAETSITVTGESTVLEAARTQIAGTVPQSEVRTLPLNGRNFLDIALLIPGVSPPTPRPTSFSPRPRRSPAKGFRLAVSAIFPTASLSMDFQITTMRQASPGPSMA
jgi:hypothetical protein